MENPLIGSKILRVHPVADQLHEAGLRAELGGDYAGAHESFAAAQQILADIPATMDSIVQAARISRDEGFTDVRAAIAGRDINLLDRGRLTIGNSIEDTGSLASGIEVLEIEGRQPQTTPKRARRELFAEHGATVSLLGRIATVRQVMSGVSTNGTNEVGRHARAIEQQPYGLAHDYLRLGNNGYYRVSNAMVGARQERLNGRIRHAGVWVGRAAVGLAWTALRDNSNFKAAARIFIGRLPHLRSYKAAEQSVLVKP